MDIYFQNLLSIYEQELQLYYLTKSKKSTKSMSKGYAKNRFPNLQGQIFDCPICLQVAKNPKECGTCGNLFCSQCIDAFKRNHHACKFGCTGNTIHPMTARALINIYEQLEIRCEKCPKVFKLGEIEKHEKLCGQTKCFNFQQCESFQDKSINCPKPVCSTRCELYNKVLGMNGNQKAIYELIKDLKPKMPASNVSNMNNTVLDLKWKQGDCGLNVQFKNQDKALYLKEEAYVFRSVLTRQGFTSGCHYWEIIADNRTENQLKIGVATANKFDFNTAFCDHKFGYAFYGLAQLRHGSNATGTNFGKRFKKAGVLGIYLNMNAGELHFSLNGEYMGKAFQDNGLTSGPIYPAVALLHCAGCSISGQLPIPEIFKNK